MITKENFEAYESVRTSGVTNMFAVDLVMDLTGLSENKIMEIITNYDRYAEEFK